MNNTKCKDCEHYAFCVNKLNFKKLKKKCKKLNEKYKGINISISCSEYLNDLDVIFNDSNSFGTPFGCSTDCLFGGNNSFGTPFGCSNDCLFGNNNSDSFGNNLSFDDDTDTNSADDNAENSDDKESSLDIHDNINKSLSEIELLNKNIESLINLLQNKLK